MLGVGTGDLYMEMFYNELTTMGLGTGVLGVGTGDLYMEMFYNELTTI